MDYVIQKRSRKKNSVSRRGETRVLIADGLDFFSLLLIALLLFAAFLLGILVMKAQRIPTLSGIEKVIAQVLPTTSQPVQAQKSPTIPEITDNDHILGNPKGRITVVQYSDLECPYCKQFLPTWHQLVTEYTDRVRFVYRHYPLSFHQNAQKEAEAAECVASLGGDNAFFRFTDAVFTRTTSNGTGFPLSHLGGLARELGLDQTRFQTCLDAGTYTKLVKAEQAGGTAAGMSATPSLFISNTQGAYQLIVGAQPFAALKTIIDQNLRG